MTRNCGAGKSRFELHCPQIRADFREGDEDSNFSVFRVRRFTEWPEPLHRIAFPVQILTKALIHWIASPLFTENPFFSLKSASSHPLQSKSALIKRPYVGDWIGRGGWISALFCPWFAQNSLQALSPQLEANLRRPKCADPTPTNPIPHSLASDFRTSRRGPENWCRCRKYFWHFLMIFDVFCPAQKMSKSVENIFDTFWRSFDIFDMAPFRWPLLRSTDDCPQEGVRRGPWSNYCEEQHVAKSLRNSG